MGRSKKRHHGKNVQFYIRLKGGFLEKYKYSFIASRGPPDWYDDRMKIDNYKKEFRRVEEEDRLYSK